MQRPRSRWSARAVGTQRERFWRTVFRRGATWAVVLAVLWCFACRTAGGDESQRGMVAGRAKEYYAEQAKERQRLSHGRGVKKGVEDLPHLNEQGKARDKAGKAFGVSGRMVDHAAKVRRVVLMAERRLGEMLADVPKHNGDPRSHDVTRLSDLGISKMQSHRWQAEAITPRNGIGPCDRADP